MGRGALEAPRKKVGHDLGDVLGGDILEARQLVVSGCSERRRASRGAEAAPKGKGSDNGRGKSRSACGLDPDERLRPAGQLTAVGTGQCMEKVRCRLCDALLVDRDAFWWSQDKGIRAELKDIRFERQKWELWGRDTLTFALRSSDIVGTGLRLRLRARTEVRLGPLLVEGGVSDIGEVAVDLRHRALPACVDGRRGADGGVTWSSPVIVAPLAHVRGGTCGASAPAGQPVAHVALRFSVNEDPEEVLAAAEASTRSAVQRLDQGCMLARQECQGCVRRRCAGGLWRACARCGSGGAKAEPLDVGAAVARAEGRAWIARASLDAPLPAPDARPEGWVCHTEPSGRTYWHHEALGPAPWDPGGQGAAPKSDASGSSPGSGAPSPLPCPEEAPDGWLSHHGACGRTFWHHSALGPAPWLKQDGGAGAFGPEPQAREPELPPPRPGCARL
ncbi:unnamed protein product [Prorocentrum cordatum]|uniref:WW domain-containing protein n=1 Tax=Prorocentrum cordatum TaxID=2364126 RepID=A0ABN9XHI1_9DINO|nr:unnamed protein product [Polarella glacialis]